MKNRWFVRLYIVLLAGITAGMLVACGSADTVDPAPTLTPTALAQMENTPSTPTAEMAEETPTEAMMSTETPVSEVQPTPTETAPSPDTPTMEVEPTEVVEPTNTPIPEVESTEKKPVARRQGEFTDADQNHTGSGRATLYQEPDGSYRLSFEDFAICCGPDLYVFLAANPAPTSQADLGDYMEISPLQAPDGNQEYAIPADADLSQINSVVIYCKQFQVIISTATLN